MTTELSTCNSLLEVGYDKKYPYIHKFFGKGMDQRLTLEAFDICLRNFLFDPTFVIKITDGEIDYLTGDEHSEVRRQDFFIIRRYMEDFRNPKQLNNFCKLALDYIADPKNKHIILKLNQLCYHNEDVMYERYSKHFPEGNYERNKNFRVLWMLSSALYFTWRPSMNVDDFVFDPPKGRRLVLPMITNYFLETEGKSANKFIKNRLDRLELILNNDIENGIVNLSGAPYVAVRIVQYDKGKLKKRVYELEQELLTLKEAMHETK